MTTKARKKFRNKVAEAAHETASGLHRIGVLDAPTMREFDASCLTTIQLSPEGRFKQREAALDEIVALDQELGLM